MAKHSLGGRTPLRGQKKERVNMSITPEALEVLSAIAEALNLPSRSEAVEYIARKEYKELQALGKSPSTHSAA